MTMELTKRQILLDAAFEGKVAAPTVNIAPRDILGTLRSAALGCRARPRTDLFEACAMLSLTPRVSGSAFLEALMRCLDQALDHAPVFYRPGVTEVSFDEAWLLRALETANQGNNDSFSFLIRSRVPSLYHRNMRYLIAGVAAGNPST